MGADEAPISSRIGGAEVRVAGVDDDARGHGLRRAAPRSRPLLSCPSPRPTGFGRQLVKTLPNRMRDKIDTNRDAKYQDVQRCEPDSNVCGVCSSVKLHSSMIDLIYRVIALYKGTIASTWLATVCSLCYLDS